MAAELDRALRTAGLPVIGVSLGREDDKTTWRVDLEPTATEAQRAQADQVMKAFVPAVPVLLPIDETPALTAEAVLAWCAEKFGVDVMDATLEVLSGIRVKP